MQLIINYSIHSLIDINECQQSPSPCKFSCQNTEGSFICSCASGYILNPDGVSCRDIDECAIGSHICQHECINTQGSYKCACEKGYNQVGDKCLGILNTKHHLPHTSIHNILHIVTNSRHSCSFNMSVLTRFQPYFLQISTNVRKKMASVQSQENASTLWAVSNVFVHVDSNWIRRNLSVWMRTNVWMMANVHRDVRIWWVDTGVDVPRDTQSTITTISVWTKMSV